MRTMHSIVRLLMLWLLIVSLPVTGIAAAAAMPCTMANAQAMAMDDCDEPGMMAPIIQSGAQVDSGSHGAHQDIRCGQDASGKHASCRTCSACHVGAVAPPPFQFLEPLVIRVTGTDLAPASFFKGWIPFLLERPPRI
ncbi:MAG: hypothetical protein EOO80_08195 [Oxalobacteraceae bacterium]|nr:MAG: hypothetical protein EOO80_08195 [Oxalobacteraceae bacterium]